LALGVFGSLAAREGGGVAILVPGLTRDRSKLGAWNGPGPAEHRIRDKTSITYRSAGANLPAGTQSLFSFMNPKLFCQNAGRARRESFKKRMQFRLPNGFKNRGRLKQQARYREPWL
jgi:hypothetical protein